MIPGQSSQVLIIPDDAFESLQKETRMYNVRQGRETRGGEGGAGGGGLEGKIRAQKNAQT